MASGHGGLRFATRAIASYSLMALWQDLRVAARLLGRHPGFTPGAVLTSSVPGHRCVLSVRRSDMPHRSLLVLLVAAIATLTSPGRPGPDAGAAAAHL